MRKNDIAGAVERLETATALDPESAQAWYQLSAALKMKGQIEASQEALRKAERLDPKLKSIQK